MPIPFLIPALIGAGGAIGGALFGKKASDNATKTQAQLTQQMISRSQPAFDSAYGYYSKLLSGGTAGLLAGAGPEVDATNLQFEQAKKNLMESAHARGGGLSKGMANIEAGKAYSISNLLQGVRPQAAAALAQLAGADQSGALQGLASAQYSAAQQAAMRSDALTGIGSILARFLTTPGLFGSSNNNSGSVGGGFPGAMNSNLLKLLAPNAVIGSTTRNTQAPDFNLWND